jgi:hypothetical protein
LKGVGEVDSTSIMKKMKLIEEQFYNTLSNIGDAKHIINKPNPFKNQTSYDDDVKSSYDIKAVSN